MGQINITGHFNEDEPPTYSHLMDLLMQGGLEDIDISASPDIPAGDDE